MGARHQLSLWVRSAEMEVLVPLESLCQDQGLTVRNVQLTSVLHTLWAPKPSLVCPLQCILRLASTPRWPRTSRMCQDQVRTTPSLSTRTKILEADSLWTLVRAWEMRKQA